MATSHTAQAAFTSVNPATEEMIERFASHEPGQIESVLDRSIHAFVRWSEKDVEQRCAALRRAAGVLRSNSERYAGHITAEMGKPIVEARAEIEKCAVCCDYYADHAASFLLPQAIPSDAASSWAVHEPLGTILAIMPWNFPFWQAIRCAAPILAAGNTMVLKHASNVSRCALDLEDVFTQAELSAGCFQSLLVESGTVASLIADPRIAAVTLTGSDVTGRKVAAIAGQNLKKTVLELGGSDAFIVLSDADLDRAATVGAQSRFQNAGQSCIAAKRFVVVQSVVDEFVERLTVCAQAHVLGDPTADSTTMGPLARADIREGIASQVERTVAAGARLVTGGQTVGERGYRYQPTVMTGVRPGMPAADEETFGPLAAVIAVGDEAEAMRVANDSPYGLGGNIWTADVERGQALARQLQSGGVFINGMTHSDPLLPFGGVKHSGYGRELSSSGVHEFTNLKTVWVGEPRRR